MARNSKHIKITCSDSYELAATAYMPNRIKAAIMMAPATGVKRRFYNSFATYLAKKGYAVITYDNRGIGESLQGSIKRSKASLIDWGQLDMPAVLKTLQDLFPHTSYHLIGHSAGGQLAGLMDNANEFGSMLNIACSSGNLDHMPFPFSFKAQFFMNVYIPLNNMLFGYTKSHWVGMGEPLPKQVAAQWRKWCNSEGYVKVELGTNVTEHLYDSLHIPSKWIHATDDGIATYNNVVEMIKVYTSINSEILTLSPKSSGYKDIGHMKFFSSKRKDLWQYAINWLDKQTL